MIGPSGRVFSFSQVQIAGKYAHQTLCSFYQLRHAVAAVTVTSARNSSPTHRQPRRAAKSSHCYRLVSQKADGCCTGTACSNIHSEKKKRALDTTRLVAVGEVDGARPEVGKHLQHGHPERLLPSQQGAVNAEQECGHEYLRVVLEGLTQGHVEAWGNDGVGVHEEQEVPLRDARPGVQSGAPPPHGSGRAGPSAREFEFAMPQKGSQGEGGADGWAGVEEVRACCRQEERHTAWEG